MVGSIAVLYVASDREDRSRAATALEAADDRIDVTSVTTAADARAALSDDGFDCVVTEYGLPDRRGTEFVRAVRKQHPDTPVLVFTELDGGTSAGDALSAGATDFLEKDAYADQFRILAHRIGNAVGGARARRERQQFEGAIDAASDGIAILDEARRFIHVNDAYAELHGYESEALLGEHWTTVYPTDDEDRIRERILPRVDREGQWEGELTGLRADGSTFVGFVHLSETPSGALACTVRTLTDRDTQLRQLETLIDSLPGIVYRCRNERGWPFEEIHGDVDSLTGYSAAALESDEVSYGEDLVHPEDRDELWETIQRAIDANASFELTYRLLTSDGATKWVWERGRAVSDGCGGTDVLEGFITDITPRKHREQDLRESERRLEALFNDPNILVGLLTPEGGVRDVNETAMEYVDASREELVGEPFWETPWFRGDPEVQNEVRDWVSRAAAGEYVEFEADLTTAVGEPLIVHGVFRPVTDEDGTVTSLLVSDRDITEQREYERELELRTKAINEAPVGIVMTDPSLEDNPITYANDEFTELTGYTREDVLGRNCRFLQGPETEEEQIDAMRSAIEAEEPITVELRNYRKDGSPFWNRVSIAPVYDPEGEVLNYIGFQSDVTERKQRQHQLQVIDRVLRHNVRNEMNVIQSHAELIRAGQKDAIQRARQIIVKSEQLIALTEKERLITELLAERPQKQEINLPAVLERCTVVARQDHPDAGITVECPPELTVTASQRFELAIDELVRNALTHSDAAAPAVSVTVAVTDEETTITVADDGPPIPEMERAALLGQSYEDPLYHGSGLGLWLVSLIVTRSEGTITYEEREPTGNRITITLPGS